MMDKQAGVSLLDAIFIVVVLLIIFANPLIDIFFKGANKVFDHGINPLFDLIDKILGIGSDKNKKGD